MTTIWIVTEGDLDDREGSYIAAAFTTEALAAEYARRLELAERNTFGYFCEVELEDSLPPFEDPTLVDVYHAGILRDEGAVVVKTTREPAGHYAALEPGMNYCTASGTSRKKVIRHVLKGTKTAPTGITGGRTKPSEWRVVDA